MAGITTVLFDLDGTLLDTLDDLAAAVNHALAFFGYPMRTREEVCDFIGNGIGNLIRRALPQEHSSETAQQVLEAFKSYYAAHNADKTQPYPGIGSMLETLRAMGCRVGVVSNKNDENVKRLSMHYFSIAEAVGEQQGVPRKPAPDGVLALMKQMGADAAHTIYVGDSQVDIDTARNAGLPCLCVTWGFRSREELQAHGGVHFANTPMEVCAFVGAQAD